MLFHSSIRRELARSFGATVVILGTVVMTMMLIKALRFASRGSFDPQDVLMVLGYSMLGHLSTLLTASLFIACVGVLSRMHHDSEMVIWFSAGRGLAELLRPALRFAWPVFVGIAALVLVVWPWTNSQLEELQARYQQRGDLERVAPGQFQESANGDRVFFIDKAAPDSAEANNVFIASNVRGKESVITARSGRLETIDGVRFLLLQDGQRVESKAGESSLKVSEFAEYGTRVGEKNIAATEQVPPAARSTPALLAEPTPRHLAELAWRLGMALAAINLVVISVAASSVNPRAGRTVNLVFSLLTFAVYYNMLNLGQSWIAAGKVAAPVLLLGLHGGVLAMGLGWLALRHHNLSLRAALFGRRRPAALQAAAA